MGRGAAGGFEMLVTDVGAHHRQNAQKHARIVGEPDAEQHVRDHVERHDEIGKSRKDRAAHPGGRCRIKGAIIGSNHVFHERDLTCGLAGDLENACADLFLALLLGSRYSGSIPKFS